MNAVQWDLQEHVKINNLQKNLEEKQVEWGKAYVALIMAASNGKEAGDYGKRVTIVEYCSWLVDSNPVTCVFHNCILYGVHSECGFLVF